MKYSILFAAFVVCMSFQCDKDNYSPCNNIKTGLILLDLELVKSGVDRILWDLEPQPTSEDPIGHEENLSLFVE